MEMRATLTVVLEKPSEVQRNETHRLIPRHNSESENPI